MTEKKTFILENYLLENGFRKNDYNEKWYYGENEQQKLNEIFMNNKTKDYKM